VSLVPGTRLGAYEILGPLGAGGMGEVYRARDVRIGRTVAIKVLPSGLSADPDSRRRFQKEALTLSSLNHPNILTIFEVGEAGADTYLVMELVPGETLRSLLAGQPLPMRRLLSIAAQVAAGLARAHAAGVVHRDLKPENIMITPDGFAKILDFGLAKRLAPSSADSGETSVPTASLGTEAGVVLGTVGYMSPEQASGKPVDDRSDQFSLGAILYEMVTGARAFSGEGVGQTLAAILRDDPPPVTGRNPAAPAPLEWIVERCLAKDPAERYASTEDLAREIATLRDHLSDAVRGTTPSRPGRRRRALWAFAGGIAAALAAAFLIGHSTAGRGTAPPVMRRLSFRRGGIWSARFTPDGETVLYGAAWDGQPIETFEARIGTVESRAVPVKNAEVLSVSSNGEMAMLLAPRLIFNYMQNGTLARASLPGGAAREVLSDVRSADWSPDGRDLAVARSVGGRDRIELPIGTLVYESSGVVGSIRVSPDGKWIAAFEYGSDRARVIAIRRDDRAVRVLSEGWRVWSVGLAWSPSGQEVWFTGTRNELGTGIWGVDLSGRQRLIMRIPGGLQIFDVHRNGRVAMAAVASRVGVAALVAGEEHPRDLSWLDSSFLGDLSSDGSNLLIHEIAVTGSGSGSIYVRPTDGGPAILIGDGYELTPLTLSPDGGRVLVRAGAPKNRLEILPTRTGETKTLPAGSIAEFGGAHWLDSRRILFLGLDGKGGGNLYLQAVDGGLPRPLGDATARDARDEFSSFAVSPDGAVVAIANRSGALSLHSVERSQSSRRVPGLFPQRTLIGWSDDGRFLYAYKIGDLPGKIYRVEIATGESQVWREMNLADPAGIWRIHPVRITSDGRSYAFSYSRRLSDLYVFEGLR